MQRTYRNAKSFATASLLASATVLAIPSVCHAYSWSFDETSGTIAHPSSGSVTGVLRSSASFAAGGVDKYDAKVTPGSSCDQNAAIEFGSPIGHFGAGDFTVAFWYKTSFNTVGSVADVIGNRQSTGHGNFFSVRLRGDGTLVAEVDQDANGLLYTAAISNAIKVNDGAWHHIAVTRSFSTLTLYVDGAPVASSNNIPAIINGVYPFRAGRSLPSCSTNLVSATASYDDLQVLDTALSAATVNTLFKEYGKGRTSGLARMFAPQLKFDQDASTFPMSAENYYAFIVLPNASAIYQNTDPSTLASGNIPIYYQVNNLCGNQVRINYWFFYGHQDGCFASAGEHNGDWEHVMVTLNEAGTEVAAVTYFQHHGWYTRNVGEDGFELSGAHPVVYVGKEMHGSYYNQGGTDTCFYYGDWRNYGNGKVLNTWSTKLQSLEYAEESWMVADMNDDFSWGVDGITTHPTRKMPQCILAACEGFNPLDTDGCADSQCRVGDPEWDTYSCGAGVFAADYDKDYLIPASDEGLVY